MIYIRFSNDFYLPFICSHMLSNRPFYVFLHIDPEVDNVHIKVYNLP